MSDVSRRVALMVDGVVHNGSNGEIACGLIVFDRSMGTIVKMFVEGVGKDVDCMTCLVLDARGGSRTWASKR